MNKEVYTLRTHLHIPRIIFITYSYTATSEIIKFFALFPRCVQVDNNVCTGTSWDVGSPRTQSTPTREHLQHSRV